MEGSKEALHWVRQAGRPGSVLRSVRQSPPWAGDASSLVLGSGGVGQRVLLRADGGQGFL